MKSNKAVLAGLLLSALAAQTHAQAPMSAIDWLSAPAAVPVVRQSPGSVPGPVPDEPAIAETALAPDVTTRPLGSDGAGREAAGLLPPHVTGLPRWLWAASASATLADLIVRQRVDRHPAMQSLLYTLLLAEANAPNDATGDDALLLARIDKLVELGAVEPAQALIERAGPDSPALFRRWFDTTLLTGAEDRACARLAEAPALAPGYGARIFCLARLGDIETADLTLGTAHALGNLAPDEAELLARFLDPELAEGMPPMPRPAAPTPLTFRMFEAIGEALSTRRLPRAFAMADLRNTSGWKAELEAAERLARTGAIPENRLIGIYTDRKPAASGGIWDRVSAVQRFDRAIAGGKPKAIAETLPGAWEAMRAARLEVPFARLYGAELAEMRLPDAEAEATAFEVALLSPAYEAAALNHRPRSDRDRFLAALARGIPAEANSPDALHQAIAAGFDGAVPEAEVAQLLDQRRLGEALLATILRLVSASSIDHEAITQSLRLFRHVGLEDTARRAALELLLLDMTG